MDDRMEKSLLEDYFDRLTFSPTPIPRKKLDLAKIRSTDTDYSRSDESCKFLNFEQSAPKFDLVVSCDQKKLVTSTMPLPRKPRKTKSNKLNQNHYEEASNDSFCFFNTSGLNDRVFFNEIKQILPEGFKDIYDLNRTKTLPRNNSLKLERPTAPPPPPPQMVHPMFSLYQSTSPNTKSHYLDSKMTASPSHPTPFPAQLHQFHHKLIDNRKKFVTIGFENIDIVSSQKKNFFKKLSKFLKLNIKFLKIQHSIFDYLVSILAFILFLICILSISFFQSKANKFYQKFLNKNDQSFVNSSNLTDNSAYFSAGSDMVKQTVVLCNGPYFSYQMNNLIVLPFSLTLIVLFSFFDGHQCLGKSYLRRPSVPRIMSPFERKNRFLIAALYCILANEIFKIIESSLFQTSYSESHNSTLQFLSSISDWNSTKYPNQSNADFLKIGLGIEPDLVQRKTRIFKTTKKTTRPFFMAPLVIHHAKPKLRPRLNLTNFESKFITASNVINFSHNNLDGRLGHVNVNLNVAESVKKYKVAKNKTIEAMDTLNGTLNNSSNQTLFQFSMSLYHNKYVQKIVHKLVDSKQFRWILVWQKVEKIAFILVEVVIIGLRYYPLMGILNKNSFICLTLACFYIWFDLLYNIALTGLCEGLRLNVNLEILKEIRRIFGVGFVYDAQEYLKVNIGGKILKNGLKSDPSLAKSSQMPFDANFLFSPNRVLYTIVKSLPHFFCLSYVAVKLTASLGKMLYSKIIWKKNAQTSTKYYDRYCEQKYVTNSVRDYDLVYRVYNQIGSKNGFNFEDRYVKSLFRKSEKPKNFLKKYFSLIFDSNFCFSTRVVCTYTVCFTVLYYFNCFLIFYGSIFIDLIYLPSVYKSSILLSSLLTSIICAVQLILSIRQFKIHLKKLYKGNKEEYASGKKIFSSTKIAARSFSYSGLAVTYTCWGYIILFFLITFVFFQVATLIEFGGTKVAFFLVIIFFPFLLSVISFRLMNRLLVSMATRFCFRSDNNFLTIKSLKAYSIFLYFKFFYDCFTGIALCFARMIKSLALSIIFLPRLDYSFMGRNMEKMDTAFMAYIGYLHWESKHTNAIVISFCKLMLKARKNKMRIIGAQSFTRARNKWQLLFMLHKNPSLRKFRIKN